MAVSDLSLLENCYFFLANAKRPLMVIYENREPISKFDFPNLALVEKELPPEVEAPPTIITGKCKIRWMSMFLKLKEN